MTSMSFAVCSAVADLQSRGLIDAALELAELALKEDPEQGRLWEMKGMLHRERLECDLAMQALEMATTLRPLQPQGRCALADVYACSGMVQLAGELYCSLLEWNETPVETLLQAAKGLDNLGRPDLSVKACREATLRDTGAARPFFEMAYYMRRSHYPVHLVESMARHAVGLDPDCVLYRVGLAALLHHLDRIGEAHLVVADLTFAQLSQVPCECCLKKIQDIYVQHEDRHRTEYCQIRLLEMEAGRQAEGGAVA